MIACFNLCISVLSGLSGLSVCVSVCVFLVFPCLRLFVNLSALTGEIKISIYVYNMSIELSSIGPYCTISSYTGFATRDDAYDVMSGLHHNAEL